MGAAQGDGSRAGWRAAFPTDRNLRHDRSGYLSGCGLVDELGVVALAGALAWQLRSIMKSDTPRLRAVETVAIGLPFLLLFYASLYALLSFNQPASFTQKLGRTDALYFTMTVFSTIGFGDIAPVTEAARIVTMTQMVAGLITVGVVARLLGGGGEAGGRTDQRGDRARGRPIPASICVDRVNISGRRTMVIGAILLGFGTGVVGRVLVPGGAFRILGTIIAGCHLKRNPGKIG